MADYRPYVEQRYLVAFDDYVARVEAFDAQAADARAYGGAPSRPGEHGLWDLAERTRYLDADGISAEIIFTQGSVPFARYPAVAGTATSIDLSADVALEAAGCRAYNRWLADFCSSDPDRHIGVARVPIRDVAAAVAEVEWARAAGLRGGILLPALTSEHMTGYNDPVYEPLWAACAALGMTINLHGGAQMSYGAGPERTALILAETDWFSRRALWFLIFSGVFERHPELHMALTEQRTHWVAPMLRDLDSIYEWPGARGAKAVIPRPPSHYFRSNCFVGASFMSRLECEARGEAGADRLMWGSDYPHQEGTWPWTDLALRWTFGCDVSSSDLRAMLGGNAARCYGLNLAALEPIARRIGPRESDLRLAVAPEQLPMQGATDVSSWAFRQSGPWH